MSGDETTRRSTPPLDVRGLITHLRPRITKVESVGRDVKSVPPHVYHQPLNGADAYTAMSESHHDAVVQGRFNHFEDVLAFLLFRVTLDQKTDFKN